MTELNQKPSPESDQKISLSQAVNYQIKIQGHLDEYWSEWFDDLAVTYDEQDDTILTGQVADQAALHGLLKKVRDLGLPLISVNPIECKTPDLQSIDGEE
jgi:hypothetical protein